MRTVVVYESVYGNTREIAEAIAEGVHRADPAAAVECLPVAEADTAATRAADLLVVGGPTHMRGMSSGLSRRMAAMTAAKTADTKAADTKTADARTAAATGAAGSAGPEERRPAAGPGLRTWFHRLPKTGSGTRAAAFDTRAAAPHSGGAARGIAQRLSRHHYDLVTEPEGFVVEGADGPLRQGELDRARDWGATLV